MRTHYLAIAAATLLLQASAAFGAAAASRS